MTQEEFKICFDLYFESIRNYIFYRCGNEELATDIAQESFMVLWEKKLNYQEGKTKSLLYKIAKEKWISVYRKEKSKLNYIEFQSSNSQLENSLEENLNYQETLKEVNQAISDLPEKQREAFLMNRFENLTYKEIAERLEISQKAVEKRIGLALKQLKLKVGNE